MTLYAVIAEGFMDYYGSKTYCIGIFDTIALAEKAANEYFELIQKRASEHPLEEYEDADEDDEFEVLRYAARDKNAAIKIVDFDLNETHKMFIGGSRCYTEFVNDKYLGGYSE